MQQHWKTHCQENAAHKKQYSRCLNILSCSLQYAWYYEKNGTLSLNASIFIFKENTTNLCDAALATVRETDALLLHDSFPKPCYHFIKTE